MTLPQLEVIAKTWVAFLLTNVVLYTGVYSLPEHWGLASWRVAHVNGVVLLCLICEAIPLLGGAIIFRRHSTRK